MYNSSQTVDRRHTHKLTFVERRKGRIWMYGELVLCAVLLVYLVSLLRCNRSNQTVLPELIPAP